MGTVIRAEISRKSTYYLSKHRYYELKHFCMQYPNWIKGRSELSFIRIPVYGETVLGRKEAIRSTEKDAEKAAWYNLRIQMVEEAATEADPIIGPYILRAVVEGLSYDTVRAREAVPCCRDIYYELYRKFFFILSEKRQ